MDRRRTLTMNWDRLGDDDDNFLESHSGSDDDYDDGRMSFASAVSSARLEEMNSFKSSKNSTMSGNLNMYDMWMAEPGSIQDRRKRLLQGMGLNSNKDLLSAASGKFNPGVVEEAEIQGKAENDKTRTKEIKQEPETKPEDQSEDAIETVTEPLPTTELVHVRSRSDGEIVSLTFETKRRKERFIGGVSKQRLTRTSSVAVTPDDGACSVGNCMGFQPKLRNLRKSSLNSSALDDQSGSYFVIKNLDNGNEFIINEYNDKGTWNKLSDLQTGKQLSVEEFEKSVGYSPVVEELMRRTNVTSNPDEERKSDANSMFSKKFRNSRRRGAAFLKNIKEVANSMSGSKGDKERPQQQLTPEHQSNKNSSSRWVKVRQHGKPLKEFTGLHLCQEIQAHEGSIWTIKFSSDTRFLASAGEDKVIHVWEVQECDVMSAKPPDDTNSVSSTTHHPMTSSSPAESKPMQPEKRTKWRSLNKKKGNSIPDYVNMPETVFSLSERPICSFTGHQDDILDLSWSKSQLLLSSSMDKTVRLWDMETKSCLKMFAHNDYVTCIQFNPVDDDYFLSGSLDAKIRIWNVPDRQVVDWMDLSEMVTAVCYSPDGQTIEALQWKEKVRLQTKLRSSERYTNITNVAENSGGTEQQVMDLELLEAAKNGDIGKFKTRIQELTIDNTPLSTIFSQLTVPDQDTFLHVAASYGHEDLAGFIADKFPELLTCRNHKGDSALHLAARAGHIGVVARFLQVQQVNKKNKSQKDDCHISYYIETHEKEALAMERPEERVAVNDEGNTALHEAMLYGHEEVALCLIESNVEAAYCVNKQGKSPLYMAVESANFEYVRNILLGRLVHMHLLDEQLTKGKSVLHAAIRIKSIEILQDIAEKKPMFIHIRDEFGVSPLDFASSTGFLEGVNFLQDLVKKLIVDTDAVNVHNVLHRNTQEIEIEDIRQSNLWEERNESLQRLIASSRVQISPEGRPQLGGDQPMSLGLYECAKEGDIDDFLKYFILEGTPPSVIYNQKTPLQNTFLHVAASFGNKDLTFFVVQHFSSLLNKKNHRGDTALHMAAASGHLGVVDTLLRFQIDQMRKYSLLDVDMERNDETVIGKCKERVLVNNDGNTPLHEALINNHGRVAEYLIKAKIEDAYYVNKQGKSALYMAIEANNIDYVKTILSIKLSYAYQHTLYEEVTKGKSLIHAAIKSRNIVLVQEIAKMKSAAIHMKDENGQSPLHYAASTNYAEGVQFLLEKRKMNIIEQDSDGFLPIHCASKYGHVGILVKLLDNCLDAREFANQDGQNILHVAAKYGKYGVVKNILKNPGLELLINEKDKEGLTALEVSEENMERTTSYRERLTFMALKSAGAGRAKLQKKPKLERQDSALIDPYNADHWKDRVNTLMLVSTLIATVTFAAGFTMPGGYTDSGPDHGMGTMLNKLTFQVFVICDTIAMYSAILVTVSLIWAQLGELTLVINSLRLAMPLLGISLTMMCLAFMAAVYVVVSKLVWLSCVVVILGLFFLACLLTLFIPFILPHSSSIPIARYLSYYSFCLLMLASGSYVDPDVEHYQF